MQAIPCFDRLNIYKYLEFILPETPMAKYYVVMVNQKIYFISCLIFICSSLSYGQVTKPVVKKFGGSKQIMESYFVLKSDGQIKHGPYVSYFQLSNDDFISVKRGELKLDTYIKLSGNYKNGKKDGEWKEYSLPSIISSIGSYENDKKIGIWKTSKEHGQVIEFFDFDTNKKLPPAINIEPKFPAYARKMGIQGVVTLKYQFHEDCTISDIQVTKSLSAECDKAAIESIQKYAFLCKKYGAECPETTQVTDVKFVLD